LDQPRYGLVVAVATSLNSLQNSFWFFEPFFFPLMKNSLREWQI